MRPERNKRFLFKVAGSSTIGFGHIRRSLTLAQELEKRTGKKNIFFHCTGSGAAAGNLLKPFRWSDGDILRQVREKRIGVIVIDELKDNASLCRKIKRLFPDVKIVCLDYSRYDVNEVDAIINLLNHNRAVRSPGKVFRGTYREGLAYALIRDEFLTMARRQKKIATKVSKVLITFGGADPKGNTVRALRILKSMRFDGTAEVILGPFFKGKAALEKFIHTCGFKCLVHVGVKNIARKMFEADVAFCGSGTTVMELCCVGTPAFVMPQNEKESKFSAVFQHNGAARVVKNLENFDDRPSREQMSRKAKQLIDGKGKKRIADFLEGSL